MQKLSPILELATIFGVIIEADSNIGLNFTDTVDTYIANGPHRTKKYWVRFKSATLSVGRV